MANQLMTETLPTLVGLGIVAETTRRVLRGGRVATRVPAKAAARSKQRKSSGFNLWRLYDTRQEAAKGAAYLRGRGQEAHVRKFPKQRKYGVYAH